MKLIWFLGTAKFIDGHTVQVVGDDGGSRLLSFKKAMIATGASPYIPHELLPTESNGSTKNDSQSNYNGRSFLTSQSFFNLTELPPRLLVIGSGPIGLEVVYVLYGQTDIRVSVLIKVLLFVCLISWRRVWLD